MIKKLTFLLPVTAGVLWGAVGIFVRVLRDFGFDAYTVISSKMIITSILLFGGLLIIRRDLLRIKLKDYWLFFCCSLTGMVLLNFAYNEAVSHLTLSFAAVLLSLSPIFVMILASIIFKEAITLKKVLCTLMAIGGCVLVSGILDPGTELRFDLIGIVLGVSAAVCYALYSIVSKAAMKKYNVFTIIAYSMLTVAILLLPFTDWSIMGDFVAAAPVKNSIFLLVYAVCTSILPYVLYTVAMSYIDAGRVSIMAAGGEPSAAMVFGCIFFSEMPTLLSVAGLIITVTAIAFICMPEKEPKLPAEK